MLRGARFMTMATNKIPTSMQAIALSEYSKPSGYGLGTVPTPQIAQPDEVLIKVHAASINPVDVKLATGMAKMMHKDQFPYKIGYDTAGTVVAVGDAVTSLKAGDEVWSRIPTPYKGSVAEYALSIEEATGKKPTQLSFAQAASIPLAGLTALQSMERADSLLEGGLKGKTVFIPGGLSGTGSIAVQLAKNVFGAGRVITTLSTGKIAKAPELLNLQPGSIEIIDYTKEDVLAKVGKETVDYFFDSTGQTLALLPIVKKGGVIVSVATVPSGDLMAKNMPDMPFLIRIILNLVDWFYAWRASRVGVKYNFIFMTPDSKGLDDFSKWIREGKVKPLVGRTAKLSNIGDVRTGCQEVYDGKGGIGKFVIEID